MVQKDKVLITLKHELSEFCERFRLKPVEFNSLFTFKLSREEIYATNMVLARELQELIEQHDFDTVKKRVARDLFRIEAGRLKSGVSIIEKNYLVIIKEVIRSVEGKKQTKLANYLKKDKKLMSYLRSYCRKVVKYNLIGKLPYLKPRGFLEKRSKSLGSMLQLMMHEGIHAVLAYNKLNFDSNAIDEGLCTYFHKEFSGANATIFYLMGGRRTTQYKMWARYFKTYFKSVGSAPEDSTAYLKAQIERKGHEKYKNQLVNEMKVSMGKHFESYLKYQDYSKAMPS